MMHWFWFSGSPVPLSTETSVNAGDATLVGLREDDATVTATTAGDATLVGVTEGDASLT